MQRTLEAIDMRPFYKAGKRKRIPVHYRLVMNDLDYTFCGTGSGNAVTSLSWEKVTCGHCLHNKTARQGNKERMSTCLQQLKAEIATCAAQLEPLFGINDEQSKIITDVTQKLWRLSAI